MKGYKNIAGQVFGHLTAVRFVKVADRKAIWLLRCVCGKEIVRNVQKRHLSYNLSCGCVADEKYNLVGKKFGQLLVLSSAPLKSGCRTTMWLCQCDCGNERVFLRNHLIPAKAKKQAAATHCGCLGTFKQFVDRTGEKFGMLTAIRIARRENNRTYWLLRCDCGNEREASLSHAKSVLFSCGCTRKNSPSKYSLREKKWRKKNAERISKKVRNHYANNKEKYVEYSLNRRARKISAKGVFTSEQWKEKLRYFGNKCYLCDVDLSQSTAHKEHRIPLSRGGSNWISNIAPACKRCNLKKNTKTEREFRQLMLSQ